MAIMLAISGRPPFSVDADTISIGSEAGVAISFPGDDRIRPRHAVIRKVAGRWMVEAREADSIQVGDSEPARLHWLNAGDVIHLVENGPTITFQPPIDEPITLTATVHRVATPSPAAAPAAIPIAVPVAVPVRPPPAPAPPVAPSGTASAPGARSGNMALPPIAPVELADLKSTPVRDKPRVRPMPQPRTEPAPRATPEPSRPTGRGTAIGIGIGAGVLAVAAGLWFGRGAFLGGGSTKRVPVKESTETPDLAGKTGDEADDSEPADLAQSPAKKSPSEKTPPVVAEPPALAELQRSLFAVLVRDAEKKQPYRLGTAWAVAPRRLVTSGAVVVAIEELHNAGLTAVVSPAGEKREIRVTGMRVHPAYHQAVEEAAAARQVLEKLSPASGSSGGTPPDDSSAEDIQAARDKLDRAYAAQANFDLGILETGQFPAQVLPWEADLKLTTPEERSVLVGLPFPIDDYRPVEGAGAGANRAAQSQGRLSPPGAGGQSDRQSLTMELSSDASSRNWSGSPVLNAGGAVVGVYSRPLVEAERGPGGAARGLTAHAVTPVGRLADFAPELR